MKAKFYICGHCGNQVSMVKDAGVPVFCCGQKMNYLEPNTVEASVEKHLPVVTLADGSLTVNVGAVDHPMIPEHYIEWVCVETEKGCQLKYLNPGEAPQLKFCVGEEKVLGVYAYCNLHGLWLTKL